MSLPDPTETFRQEARELLDQLEQGLLDLEHDPQNADLVNSTFRALHTIKGSGAMFGFTEVATFVHEFETAFDRVRKGLSPITSDLIAIALDAKDQIHRLIEQPDAAVAGSEDILERLRVLVSTDRFPELPMPREAAVVTPAPAVPAAIKRWRLRFTLPRDALLYGTNPLLLLDELRAIGPCDIVALTDKVPPLGELDPEGTYLGWQVDITADDPASAIDDVFLFLRDGMDLTLEPLSEGATPAAVTAPVAAAAPAPTSEPATPLAARSASRAEPQPAAAADKSAASSLRVSAERLDELMDRVGELVIAQARLTQ
ncbi:MAG TPA: Hpt domain-containing protein, partial [Devosia sp.]|nr:Hpt domain-containing protein [Devosia sp.]